MRTVVKSQKDGKLLFQFPGKTDMSDFPVRPEPASPYLRLIDQTAEACRVAKEAAAIVAEGIATGSQIVLDSLRDYESELDKLDNEIDVGVTSTITQVNEPEARELLACMKFAIGLERIGDLLLVVGSSAQEAGALDPQDTRDLIRMATMLEKMLADVGAAFSSRDLTKAVDVLKSDAEMDRLRGLLLTRHIENAEVADRRRSLQIVFMTQSLERAGDHAKNLAEEVCHFVSGHTVRHLLNTYDKPLEQIFRDWLQQSQGDR